MANILDFLTRHDIPWFPIILDIQDKQIDDPYVEGLKKKEKTLKPIKKIKLYAHPKEDKDGKKYTSYMPQYDDFWNLTPDIIKARQQMVFDPACEVEFNSVWIDTREYPQVDLDCPLDNINDGDVRQFLTDLLENTPHYTSMTKPYGHHLFLKWDEDDRPDLTKMLYKFKNSDGTKNSDVDFLCGQGAYAHIHSSVDNYNVSIHPWDYESMTREYIYIETPTKKTTITKNINLQNKHHIYDKFWDYFHLIDNTIMSDYAAGWFECACIHKNIVGDSDYERFDKFCSQFDGYNETENKTIYDGINEPRSGWKKMYQYAYGCDNKKKMALDNKYGDPAFSLTKFLNIKTSVPIDEDTAKAFKEIEQYSAEKQREIKKKYMAEAKRVDDELYKNRKYYFEKFHAKILSPICFIRVYGNTVVTYKKTALTDCYENLPNKFIEHWRKDPYIKTYEKMDFLPPPLVCPPDIYNTYKGFRIANMNVAPADDFSILLEQLKYLTNDEAGYEYMIKYLAHLVQRPGEMPGVMIIFRSVKQGVGKNIFFEHLSETMIGREYYVNTADIEKLVGRFPVIDRKFVVCLDEAHGKDTFGHSNKIKNLITSEKFTMETKGVDAYDIRNLARLFAFTNSNNSMPTECWDRRNINFDCDCIKVGDDEYFNKLVAALDSDAVVKAFYNFLLTVDICGWRPHIDRPKTEFYNDMKMACMGIDKKFMYYFIQLDEYKDMEDVEIQSKELYEIFSEFCQNEEQVWMKNVMTHTKFSLNIKSQFKGCIETKKASHVMYVIHINLLREMLTELGF